MRKIPLTSLCIVALVAFAAWAPNAGAYEEYQTVNGALDNCSQCHPGFDAGFAGPLHSAHLVYTSGCTPCHTAPGQIPVLTNSSGSPGGLGCSGCHQGGGLQLHHTNAGAPPDGNGLTCAVCHPGATSPPESTPPAYYADASITTIVDPCQSSPAPPGEDFDGDGFGLDNDGDLLYDGDDPDCQPAVEICDNGVDDTGNGLIDCEDPQCDGFVGEPTTCGIGACAAAGNLVCQTPDQVDTCTPGTPQAEGPFGDPTCVDGVDNDCDGLTDAADPDCEAPPEICDNGIDDNGNGLIDCEDPQCEGFVGAPTTCGIGGCEATGNLVCQGGATVDTCVPGAPGQEGPAGDPTCADGVDNDCNGLTDAADPACEAVVEEICDNGIDDNGNGLIDCEDPQCEGFVDGPCDTGQPGICAAGTFLCQGGAQVCVQDQEPGQEGPFGDPTCVDGVDNDCNGLTDAADPACQAPVEEICDNGIDDNANGLIDCEDPACDGFVNGACDTGEPGICAAGTFVCQNLQSFCVQDQQPQQEGPAGDPSCQDGLDNDCDGLTDLNDPDCQAVDDKVTICHIPPGNPDKARTLRISAESVADHLAHGDTLGACPQ